MPEINGCANPALGADAADWFNDGTHTAVRTTATGFPRPDVWRITFAGGTGWGRVNVAVTPGDVVSVVMWAAVNRAQTGYHKIDFFDSGGGYLSSSPGTSPAFTTTPTGHVLRNVTVPASAAVMGNAMFLFDTPVGDTLDLSACRVVLGDVATIPYFDGESAGWVWDGTQYNSASSEAPVSDPPVYLRRVAPARR